MLTAAGTVGNKNIGFNIAVGADGGGRELFVIDISSRYFLLNGMENDSFVVAEYLYPWKNFEAGNIYNYYFHLIYHSRHRYYR